MPFFPLRLTAKLFALFCLVLGAKFCVMRACSSPLPYFDQWNGEGVDLLQPWLHGDYHWLNLFAFHVQHRIVLTRLFVLGLFTANGGQWDTQVEMIVAAGCHALCAVGLAVVLVRRLGPAAEDKVLAVLALLFALPFGWENTLSGGFQSQFYFLLGLSFVTIWGLGTQRALAPGWWLGVGTAVLAYGSMGSAPLTPLAVAAATVLQWRQPGRDPRADRITLGVAAWLCAVGFGLCLGVDPNAHLQPRSMGAFAEKFLGLLGWPNPTALAAPLAYAPWTWLLVRRLRQPHRLAGAAERFLLPLGIFALLNTAAIAFGRNQYRGLLVSRYMDVLSIGALVNFACLLQFAGEARTTRENTWLRAAGAGWLGLLACGLGMLTARNVNADLPFMRVCNQEENGNVTALVAHPDPALLHGKNAIDYQCQDARLMMRLVQDPLVRAAMPAQSRRPLPLLPVAATANGVHPVFMDTSASAPDGPPDGWQLDVPAAGAHATIFRSQTIDHALPYLRLVARGEIGRSVRLGLVGDRTGRTEWVWPPDQALRGDWWTATLRAPPEPFHLEAAVTADAADRSGMAFLCPREMGWLSAWVEPVLNSAYGLLLAGVALWLAAAFGVGMPVGDGDRNFNAETPRTQSYAEQEEMEMPAEEAAMA